MRHLLVVISILFQFVLINEQGHATTVDVYAEGGYTATHIQVDIFADITSDEQGGPLRSAGVKLTYPAELLTNPSPEKNEADWYFGLPDNTISYASPDVSTAGEILFVLGKFDITSPLNGVNGVRILLGTVLFERRLNTAIPVSGDFALTEGKVEPYIDFITIRGQVLDDSVFFQAPAISSQAQLDLEGTIRILQMLTGQDTDVPLRPLELDSNIDGRVGLEEATNLLREISR